MASTGAQKPQYLSQTTMCMRISSKNNVVRGLIRSISRRGCTRRAAIGPNKHQRIGNDPQPFRVRNTRIGAADMPCHGATSWINSPRDFPKWAESEVFRSVGIGKDGWALDCIRKVPGPKWKTAILQAKVLGLFTTWLPHRHAGGCHQSLAYHSPEENRIDRAGRLSTFASAATRVRLG